MIAQGMLALLHVGPHNSSEAWFYEIGLSLVLVRAVWYLTRRRRGEDESIEGGESQAENAC